MEKYGIFSGLKGFEILNLRFNTQLVPKVKNIQKGKVNELLKLGSQITYDIDSLDMWLDIRIECIEISLIITLEIKVEKKLSCGDLKLHLLKIINQLLILKNLQLEYDEDDIKLIKAKLDDQIIITKDARSSVLDRKIMPKRVHELEDLRLIEEEFCYMDRYIICTIQKHISEKSRDSFQKRLTINPNTNSLVTGIFDSFKQSMPCRGINIEHYKNNKNLEVKLYSELMQDQNNSACCICVMI